MSSQEYIQTDYDRAKNFYSNAPPALVGRLIMSQESAQTLPFSLEEVYTSVFEAVNQLPSRAQKWASTFGTLSVNIALDNKPTNFQLADINDYKPPNTAEISTSKLRFLPDTFYIPQRDASMVFLLANDKPVKAEMALIQALHMVDVALVTSQFDDKLPLVLSTNSEELVKLRRDFPEILLRSYGNVRQAKNILSLLGSVVPTSTFEKSGIEARALDTVPKQFVKPKEIEAGSVEREPAAFIGITTAKRPHIGHGFLLVKAIAETADGGRVVVELNDRGPRVVEALAMLALSTGQTISKVAAGVTNGTIGFKEIEEAYKVRGEAQTPEIPPDFSLAEPNQYYRDLLTQVTPPEFTIDSIADSELRSVQFGLKANNGYTALFDNAGMSILKDSENKAVVVEQAGNLTIAGVLATLSTRYSLMLVDSPAPLSSVERSIFKDTGLEIGQSNGVGVMIDFSVASGTSGNTIKLEDLLQIAEAKGDVKLLLPTIREVMNSAYFLPSDGGSVSPNFANIATILKTFESALDKVAKMDDPFAILYEPLVVKDAKREIVKDLLAPISKTSPLKGKSTVGEIQGILEYIPTLKRSFSQKFLNAVERSSNPEQIIPKIFLEEADRQIVQVLRSATPDKALAIVLELAEEAPTAFERIATESKLKDVVLAMGYDSSETVSVMRKLNKAKGLYKVI